MRNYLRRCVLRARRGGEGLPIPGRPQSAVKAETPDAMRVRISVAHERGALALQRAVIVSPDTSVADALQLCNGGPVLVLDGTILLGIATPFDFL